MRQITTFYPTVESQWWYSGGFINTLAPQYWKEECVYVCVCVCGVGGVVTPLKKRTLWPLFMDGV